MSEFGKKKIFGAPPAFGEPETKIKIKDLTSLVPDVSKVSASPLEVAQDFWRRNYSQNFADFATQMRLPPKALDRSILARVSRTLWEWSQRGFSPEQTWKKMEEGCCPVCSSELCMWPDSEEAYALGVGGKRILRRSNGG